MAKRTINLDTKEIEELIEAIGSKDVSCISKLKNALKTIKTSSAKGKGRNLQMRVCEAISRTTGITYDQSDDDCLIHSREMGQHGSDVVLRGRAKELFPFSVECKSSESLNLMDAVNQAKSNAGSLPWMVVHKRKSLPAPVAILDFDVFCSLVGKACK